MDEKTKKRYITSMTLSTQASPSTNHDIILLIDKPAGMTSHDVVDRVRRAYKTRRVGHAGTLDPFATGLLIIGVDRMTKRLAELVGLDKTYEAELTLGATSTTFDPEGEITRHESCNIYHESSITHRQPERSEIENILSKFRGGYVQRAPIYSAKKIHGKKLYELARAGQATDDMRPSKFVKISELEIIGHDRSSDLTFRGSRYTLHVTCSSGTYIRSLADDIGRALGCGAYLSALRRTRVGPYRVEDAHTLAELPILCRSRTLDIASKKC